jgi:molecular chaperone HtpG
MSGIVEELVHQFTDPFAFYRELIQNSIDAGSTRIEVSLSFRPASHGKGLMLIAVADWGEGMNRDVIENYLVTKFRSTKENDLTKIGKFGIGFVSIFACKPDAVTVDTGRDGEFWRVLFRSDTTWELLKLPDPLEGTTVTLHKELPAAEYPEFVRRSRESLSKWCKHSDVDVTFTAGEVDGSAPGTPQPVKEPLAVDAPFQVEHVEDGTHIIAGPSRTSPAVTGMYNRGLTLLETTEPLIPGVTMKIVSRYLEHTLTRDNVRRDKHFSHAMGLAKKLVDEQLVPKLGAELEKAAQVKTSATDWTQLFPFARTRLKPRQLVYRLCGGGAVTHEQLVAQVSRDGALITSPKKTPLVDRLLDAGTAVIDHELHAEVAALVKAKQVVIADEVFTYAAPPERATPAEFAAALRELLEVPQVEVAEVRGAAADKTYVWLERLSRCVSVTDAIKPVLGRKSGVLCLNLAHPAVAKAAPLFAKKPRLAALLIARLVLVHEGKLSAAKDQALTKWGLT